MDARKEPILPTKSKAEPISRGNDKKNDTNLLLRFIDTEQNNYGQSIVAPKATSYYNDRGYQQEQNFEHYYGNGYIRGSHQLHHLKHSNSDNRNGGHYQGIDMINI